MEIKKYINKEIKKNIDEYDLSIDNIKKIFNYKMDKIIIIFIIYNNEIYIINKNGDSRKNIIIENIKKYYKNKKIRKNIIIPFFISDSYFYFDNNIPFFIESKPQNKKGILIPTTSLYHIKMNKYINYNKFSEILDKKECNKKIKKIYFRGANTGYDKYNIRKKLKDIVKEKNNKKYNIIIGEKHIPMYIFCKYKYLLNLPGNQPWSYRLMNLLQMNSLIINVNVLQSYNKGENYNDKWINFFDNYFNDCMININYKWIENITSNNDVINLYNKINKIYNYYEKNEKEYNIIINKLNKKKDELNMKNINYAFNNTIYYFIKKIYKINKKEIIDKLLLQIINNKKYDILKI
jgi:hypothetical protein